MIPASSLRHTVFVDVLTNNGKDDYGNSTKTSVVKKYKCYFDGQVEDATFFYQKQAKRAEAIIFVLPSTKVKVGDRVLKVQDIDGNDIISDEYIIAHILPSADLNRMHHIELYLVTSLD